MVATHIIESLRPKPVGKAVLGLPLAAILRWRLRRSNAKVGLAVLYHRVDRTRGDPARELLPALDKARFASHVRHLKRDYRLVHASDLPGAAASRRAGERVPVAITFDDDLPEFAEIVLPILSRHEATATFFLCGASLETPFSFWWERLQRAFDQDMDITPALAGKPVPQIPPGQWTVHSAVNAIHGLLPSGRSDVAAGLADLLGPDPPNAGMRAADIEALIAAGFGIGFHTREHHTLTDLDDAGLEDALRAGRSDLEALTGHTIDVIAYPFGEVDRRVTAAARDAGYRVGFSTVREPVGPGSDPLCLGRYEPWLASLGTFAFDVARALGSGADQIDRVHDPLAKRRS